jgi:hypothetical protein
MKSLIVAAILSATLTGALAFNYGGDGSSFGHMGASTGAGTGNAPASCSSGSLMNGIFDLTNTCNDIYFIGGLK